MSNAIYKGFSTAKWLSSNGSTLRTTNMEAVKQELLTHIFTAPGERLSLPNWGTRIPLMVFEQNDEITREIILTDCRMVAEYDPRVRLVNIHVLSLPDNNAIICLMDLLYIEFNVVDTLHIEVPTSG